MPLELRELLLVALRWAHAAAAAVLVGGSAVYLLVLAPALRAGGLPAEPIRRATDQGFKEIVDITLVVFLVSGGLLTFDRLSSGAASTLYVILLGLKVVLSLITYRWAFSIRRGRGWSGREGWVLVGSGFAVILLASMLKTLYEGGLRS